MSLSAPRSSSRSWTASPSGGPVFSPGRRTGVLRARSAMNARSASTGPSKRRTRSTGMPASWATSSAVAPALIRAWMSRGRRWLSTSISICPRRGRSPRTAARSRSSIGSVYSVLSAALSTSRVPSLETATTRSSGMGTSRVVPADVTCVAASASRVWPARVQPATTLPSCPACRAPGPGSPSWHGYLFATSSDPDRSPWATASLPGVPDGSRAPRRESGPRALNTTPFGPRAWIGAPVEIGAGHPKIVPARRPKARTALATWRVSRPGPRP